MKIALATAITFLLSSTVNSLTVPPTDLSISHGHIITPEHQDLDLESRDLEKRRGGGGRGGGGGGGGGRGGSGGSSGGRGGSSSSGSRPPGSPGSRPSSNHPAGQPGSSSPTSNSGGYTRGGSGPPPAYGGAGGGYYSGGAVSPYRSGIPSPLGIRPYFLPVAALAFFPGLWLYGAQVYPYDNRYHYRNETNNRNESLPVVCLCEQYKTCGCDDNNNSTYYESIFNGTQPRNGSIVRVTTVNDTKTIAINGTLPNGTTVDEATLESSAAALELLQASGYWVMAAVVGSAIYTL
ncbi:hypothetical protein BJY04DRAFT_163315 [Aspergillus karnatakaensis]|uniref:uncharacterized protein n=1 Tax=Aspergillus karnatakaensis TaxID=1810916 RepID=UPI003CCDEB92